MVYSRIAGDHVHSLSSNTHLIYCTIGVLLRYINNDKYIHKYSHIIIDEVHERSVDSDFLLAILKQVIEKNKEIKVYESLREGISRLLSCLLHSMNNYFQTTLTIVQHSIFQVVSILWRSIIWKPYSKRLSIVLLSTTIYRYVPSRNVFEELEDSFPKSTSSTPIEDMLYRYSCKYIDYNMVTATISYIIKVLFLFSINEYLD